MQKRRSRQLKRLVAAQRRARLGGESAAQWWQQLTAPAASATTRPALDGAFRDALAAMRELLNADALAVVVSGSSGETLMARAATGLAEDVTVELAIASGQGMAGRVMEEKKPLVFSDLQTVKLNSPILRDSGLRSAVAVPLLGEDRVHGVLWAGSLRRDHFGPLDAQLLELMGVHFAVALERVHAFERERRYRLRAEQSSDRLTRMQAASARLVGAASVEEIADTLTDSLGAGDLEGNPLRGELWLLRADHLDRVGSSEPGQAVALSADVPLTRAVRDRRPCFGSGGGTPWLDREVLAGGLDPDGGSAPEGSWAVLPLLAGGDCLGAAAVALKGSRPLERDERTFLSAVVDETADAVARATMAAQQRDLARVSAFFAQVARAMTEASGFADALDRLAHLALDAIGDVCLIDILGEDGEPTPMVARYRDPALQHLVDRMRSDFPPRVGGSPPGAEVIRTGRTLWSASASDEWLDSTVREGPHRDLVRLLGLRSYVSAPLQGEQGPVGSITLVSTRRPFDEADVRFVEHLADQVAAIIDHARRFEDTATTSHVLQQSLLPHQLPEVAGLTVATRYLPATRGLEVGGDFYDLVPLPGGQVGVMIGDVAGHDRGAAALMGQLRSAVRALAGQIREPSKLVAALQWSWGLLGFDRIATALIGRFDPASREVVLASAGHHPPLLIRSGTGSFLPVKPGTPLGVPGAEPVEYRERLEPGDALLLYTDGVLEERSLDSDDAMDRLARVATAGDPEPNALCDRVVGMLAPDRSDDVAVMALRLDA